MLIHVADMHRALGEMIRVLRPGGLLAVAEPNNLAASLVLSRTRWHEDPETTLALVRLQLTSHRTDYFGCHPMGRIPPLALVRLVLLLVLLVDALALWA